MKRLILLLLLVLILVISCSDLELVNKRTKYYVTYVFDNGEDDLIKAILPGNKAIEIETPKKTNYNFIGWYSNSTKWNFSTPINDDLELKAKYETPSLVGTWISANGAKYTFLNNGTYSYSSSSNIGSSPIFFGDSGSWNISSDYILNMTHSTAITSSQPYEITNNVLVIDSGVSYTKK